MDPPNDATAGAGSSSGGPSSRWNPTKEQLSLLESLYGQGIRTPSAEQIQSITKRLQAYGHIEGKNVFYWFQNHKARQRQKQKMDQQQMMMMSGSFSNNNSNNVVVANNLTNVDNVAAVTTAACFNRFYYPSPPVSPSVAAAAGCPHPLFPADPHSVAYSPYHIARPEFGFYPHCPKMVLPNHILPSNNSPMSLHPRPEFHRNMAAFSAQNISAQNNAASVGASNGAAAPSAAAHPSNASRQAATMTLDLFPVHPTGILRQREDRFRSPSTGSSTENDALIEGSDQDRHHGRPAAVRASSSSASWVGFDVFSKLGD